MIRASNILRDCPADAEEAVFYLLEKYKLLDPEAHEKGEYLDPDSGKLLSNADIMTVYSCVARVSKDAGFSSGSYQSDWSVRENFEFIYEGVNSAAAENFDFSMNKTFDARGDLVLFEEEKGQLLGYCQQMETAIIGAKFYTDEVKEKLTNRISDLRKDIHSGVTRMSKITRLSEGVSEVAGTVGAGLKKVLGPWGEFLAVVNGIAENDPIRRLEQAVPPRLLDGPQKQLEDKRAEGDHSTD